MLNYLLSPEFQIVNTAGRPCTGYLEVFIHGSRERYYCASDFNGTLYPFQVPLDSLGSNVVLADDSNAYDVYVYNRYGSLLMSRYNVHPNGSGGGGTGVSTEITSSDGSINIDKITGDYETTFDLTVARDGQDLLEYVRCDGATQLPDSYIYLPTYTEGTIAVGEKGLLLSAGNYYHVTAHVRATKSVQRSPFYDEVNIRFVLDYGNTQTDTAVEKRIVDYSLGLSQEFEVSTDVMPSSNCELLFVIDGQDAQNGSFQLLDVEAHRVYSGAPNIPSGVLSRVQAREIYQPILTAGENITIEDNVISATGGGPTYTAGNGIDIQNDEISVDTTVVATKTDLNDKQDTLTAGSNISIVNNVISATAAPQVNADWDASSGVSEILNKPDLSIYAVSSDLATVATSGSYNDLLNKPSIPSAQINADWTSSSGVSEILHKPAEKDLVAGSNITITESNDTVTISAAASAQVNADWDATSGVSEILHKPDLSIYAVSSDLATVATSGSYNDLLNKPSIPSAQVNADWGATSGVSAILNKPNLATVATTGDYSDLQNLPSIPAAQVNSDWDATSGVSQILNKPSIPTATSDLTNDSSFITLSDVPAQVNADWNASSGVSEILNKPTIPSYTAGNGIDITSNVVSAKVDGTTINTNASGELTVIGGGEGGGSQVNSDWDATSGVAEILNKPVPKTLTAGQGISIADGVSTITISSNVTAPVQDVTVNGTSVVSNGVAAITSPTVDQTYDGTSANAQSGVAVAEAISAAVIPISIVSALPANPDPNTLYVVTGA